VFFHLTRFASNDESLAALAAFPNLRSADLVDLRQSRMTQAGLRRLATLSLERLDLPPNLREEDAFGLWLQTLGKARRVFVDSYWPDPGDRSAQLAELLKSRPDILAVELEHPLLGPEYIVPFEGANLVDLQIPDRMKTDQGISHWLAALDVEARGGAWDFTDWHIGDFGLEKIAALRGVKALDLTRTQITDAGLQVLTQLPDLEELSLAGTQVTDAGLERVAVCLKLRLLDLSATRITDAGVKTLARLPNLRTLDLRDCQLDGSGLRALSGAGIRDLAYTVDGAEPDELAAVVSLPGLESLDLRGSALTNSDLAVIAQVGSLRRLDVSASRRTAESVLVAAGALERAQRSDSGRIDAPLFREGRNTLDQAGLAPLLNLENLEVLAMSGCKIGDAGAAMLAKLPKLRALDVSFSNVQWSGVDALLQSPSLESLDFIASDAWIAKRDAYYQLTEVRGLRGIAIAQPDRSKRYFVSSANHPIVQPISRPRIDWNAPARSVGD
jgi:Leucine-rich repeat (LRR) protein